MKKILLILLMSASLIYAKEYKVVFDLTTDSQTTLENKLLKNVAKLRAFHKANGDTLKVAVVISGGSYKFFLKKDTGSSYFEEEKRQVLRFSKNADIEVCSMGMAKRNIKEEELYDFVVPAFNKVEALIRYQNMGYAYINVH